LIKPFFEIIEINHKNIYNDTSRNMTGYPSIHWTESDKNIHRSTFL